MNATPERHAAPHPHPDRSPRASARSDAHRECREALHGAPVMTLDFDFMFRDTPTNLRKLKAVAADLHAMILRPFYPVSRLYRVVDDDTGLQVDFMPLIHGVRSFEGLRSRSAVRDVDGLPLRVASLEDITASKKAAGRDRDKAVLPISGKNPKGHPEALAVARTGKPPTAGSRQRAKALAALEAESERQLEELIRRRLALPLEKRMNFLRRRLPGGGSAL